MLIYPKVKIQFPISLEREYARELVKYVRKVRDICKQHVPAMVDAAMWNTIHADDWTEEQTEEIDKDITAEEEAAIMAIILAMFNRVKTFNRRQQENIFRSIFGSTPKEISKEDYDKGRIVVYDRKALGRGTRLFEYSQDVIGRGLYTNHYLTTERCYFYNKLFKCITLDVNTALDSELSSLLQNKQ